MNDNDKDILKLLLESTQAKLSEVEALGNIGTWEYNLKTHEVLWSEQMYKIFERSKAAGNPTFQDVHDKIHCTDRFHWELLINKVSIDGGPVQIVIRLLGTKDDVKWIRKSAQGVFEGSKLVAIKGTCQDITEIKRLESHFELTRDLFEDKK